VRVGGAQQIRREAPQRRTVGRATRPTAGVGREADPTNHDSLTRNYSRL